MSTIIHSDESAKEAHLTELRNAYPELSRNEANVTLITDQNSETDSPRFVLRSIIQFDESSKIPFDQKLVICFRFTKFGRVAYLDLVSLGSLLTVDPYYGPRHLDIVREHAKRTGVWPDIPDETKPSSKSYALPFIIAGGKSRMTYPPECNSGHFAFYGNSIDFGKNVFGFSFSEIAQEVFFQCYPKNKHAWPHRGGAQFIKRALEIILLNSGNSFYDFLDENEPFGSYHSWELNIMRALDMEASEQQ